MRSVCWLFIIRARISICTNAIQIFFACTSGLGSNATFTAPALSSARYRFSSVTLSYDVVLCYTLFMLVIKDAFFLLYPKCYIIWNRQSLRYRYDLKWRVVSIYRPNNQLQMDLGSWLLHQNRAIQFLCPQTCSNSWTNFCITVGLFHRHPSHDVINRRIYLLLVQLASVPLQWKWTGTKPSAASTSRPRRCPAAKLRGRGSSWRRRRDFSRRRKRKVSWNGRAGNEGGPLCSIISDTIPCIPDEQQGPVVAH